MPGYEGIQVISSKNSNKNRKISAEKLLKGEMPMISQKESDHILKS